MKLDFPHFGGGSPIPLPRRLIERRMRQLEVRPIDDSRGVLRVGMIAGGVFFGLFLMFALFAPLAGAAIAPGAVVTSGSKLLIQPVGSGIVSELLVREGQMVRAGQPLVRLNGVRSGAQLRQAQARLDALMATEARLIAERDDLDALAFPPALTSRMAEPSAADAMRAEAAIFARHQALLRADRGISDVQLQAAKARQAAASRQLSLINDELEGIQSLYRKGYARKTTVRSLQRSAAQLEADRLTGLASISEAELNRAKLRDSQVMDIVSQLGRVQAQLAQLRPQLDITRYFADHDVMRAPAAGRVADVASIGPGTVVSGGRTLMELVPSGRALIVEARVKPEDVDDVRIGAPAHVRFSSVNPHGQSSFAARVVTMSPTAIGGGQDGPAHYKVQVAVDDPGELGRAGVALQPGIPASVQIETQQRTLMSYLLQPLTDAMSRSFREE